ncbi:secretin N-terminal domain-containing protein [Candidatus Cyanaurora vandensis]|uniref:secretin N-terminal domain-containing protein n=1 Tax=Candidatus Cyanaurora vandensis TaxID=2714958 RepID=UPI00257A6A2C|nr:secretin N-terminal domain-containing protein [Candidatus Cyanaurora vandensis]
MKKLLIACTVGLTLLIPVTIAQTFPNVTAVKLEGGSFFSPTKVILELKGTTRPELTMSRQGSTTFVDLKEAVLALKAPEVINNPGGGVTRLEVRQLDERTVRIILTGQGNPPEVKVDVATPSRVSLILGGGPGTGVVTNKATETLAGDLRTPDRPEPSQNRQFSARAIAPPTGDVAIASLNVEPLVRLGTNDPITLVLKDAPAREVLTLMARRAGLNAIFAEDVAGKTVSVDVQSESLEQTFNLILRLTGLKAQKIDRTLVVGATLPQDLVQSSIRTYRLNQANVAQVLPQLQQLTAQLQETIVPIVDPRTNSLTIVGSPRALKVASALIAQLDVRKRQVMIALKLVDVDLLDTKNLGIGFGYQLGKFSIGSLETGNVGTPATFITFPSTSTAAGSTTGTTVSSTPINGETTFPGGVPTVTRLNIGTPIGPAVSDNFISSFDSTVSDLTSQLQARIQASVQAGNSKILADPKLVLESGVGVTDATNGRIDISDDVIVGTQITVDPATGLTSTTVQKDRAGVILDVQLFNIDDNGYVNLGIRPSVSSIISTQRDANNNLITLLSRRNIDIRRLRLRDGQTLVLAGLIQDQDITAVNKVPILGDIPILGVLFRFERVQNRRRELALMVTPYVLKDPVETGTPPTSIQP